jgi:hypothetical protein
MICIRRGFNYVFLIKIVLIIVSQFPEILNHIHAFREVNKIRVNKTILISIKYKCIQF